MTETPPHEASSAKALKAVVEETAQATGTKFFACLCCSLAKALDVRYCFVTECLGSPPARVRTLAFWAGEGFVDDIEYPLEDTPCHHVIDEERGCIYGRRIQQKFPRDRDLVDMAAESYVAAPMLAADDGRVLGHLVVIDTAPTDDGVSRLALLKMFAGRAAAELQRQRAMAQLAGSEARMRAVVEGTARAVGGAFFRSLTRHLASAMNTSCAFLAEFDGDILRTRSIWGQGGHLGGIEMSIAEAPGQELVASKAPVTIHAGLGDAYGHLPLIADLELDSYLGTPLIDAGGEVIGVLAVLDRKPIEQTVHGPYLLSIFAARAVAELERERIENHRHELQRQVQHVQKLESLGLLAGGIAHDFNNLLSAILGNVDLANSEIAAHSPARKRLFEIELAAVRCAELANQMLAYSGKGKLVAECLDLNAMAEEITGLLKSSISKKAQLTFDLEPTLPVLEGDPTQIRQVLMNLVINASDALAGGNGTIGLTTRSRHVDRTFLQGCYMAENVEPGRFVVLEVEDDGGGMDAATLGRLFDPFFTTKETGRGLGLAALLGIVRSHYGAVHVVSHQGQGTCFTILLPAATANALRDPVGRAATPDWRGTGTVLVVDDELVIRTVAQQMLEDFGFEVLLAENGRQGLKIFEQNRDEVQLVLLDLMMPELDGLEVLRQLRRSRPEIKVILSSGYTKETIAAAIAQDVHSTFLHKPYQTAELGTRLQQMLSN